MSDRHGFRLGDLVPRRRVARPPGVIERIHRRTVDGAPYRDAAGRRLELGWEIARGPRHDAISAIAMATGAAFGIGLGLGGTAGAITGTAVIAIGRLVGWYARTERRTVDLRLDADHLLVAETTDAVTERFALPVAAIEQLHVADGPPRRPCRLFVWLRGACDLLAEVARRDEALYIERTIEDWLCIPDRAVAGELPR